MGDLTEIEGAEGAPAGAVASEPRASLDDVLWERVAAATLLRAQPRFDELVLDAGSGAGAATLPTAELVGIGGLVDALVADERAAAALRERAGDRMPQLHVLDTALADWATVGYDLVQCVLGIAGSAGARGFDPTVADLVAHAKPGGRVLVTVWAAGALDPLPQVAAEALAAELEDGPDPGALTAALQLGPEQVDTAGTLALHLGEHGLANVRSEAVTLHLEIDPGWEAMLASTLGPLLDGLDDDAVERVRRRSLDALASRGIATLEATVLVGVGQRRT